MIRLLNEGVEPAVHTDNVPTLMECFDCSENLLHRVTKSAPDLYSGFFLQHPHRADGTRGDTVHIPDGAGYPKVTSGNTHLSS